MIKQKMQQRGENLLLFKISQSITIFIDVHLHE